MTAPTNHYHSIAPFDATTAPPPVSASSQVADVPLTFAPDASGRRRGRSRSLFARLSPGEIAFYAIGILVVLVATAGIVLLLVPNGI